MRKSIWFRFVLVILAFVMACSLGSCGFSQNDDDEEDDKPTNKKESNKTSSILNLKRNNKGAYQNLVINDSTIADEDYIIEKHGRSTYILLCSEIITFPFRLPYSSTPFPEFSTENGQITLTWSDQDVVLLKVDMTEDSKEVYINNNDEPIDIGVAPRTVDDKLFIPINLISELLKLTETYDRKLNITFLHCQEKFPSDLLIGSWSNSHTDVFTLYKDSVSGAGSLSSFELGLQYDKDGTYSQIAVGVGGYTDKLVQCKGKYKILGNTIIYYDTYETLYEGNPFKLVYKNKKLDHPNYDFIYHYDPNENRINIDSFWLNKVDD